MVSLHQTQMLRCHAMYVFNDVALSRVTRFPNHLPIESILSIARITFRLAIERHDVSLTAAMTTEKASILDASLAASVSGERLYISMVALLVLVDTGMMNQQQVS